MTRSTITLINGDCREVLIEYKEGHFSAASFSPPYGVGSEGFDIRKDFTMGGAFIPFMQRICWVADVVAINITQRVHNTKMSIFIEQLVIELARQGITLFDRWIVLKPVAMPRRGNRALTHYEYVLLFTRLPHAEVVMREGETGFTVIEAVGGRNRSNVRALGTTPYPIQIPEQVFRLYGVNKPVLDPFCGSGTSLVAAEELGLDSVGIELNKEIFRVTSEALS